MPPKLLALLLICAVPMASAQSIYSWKDASGRVHYSDNPPPDAQTRKLREAPIAPARPAVQGQAAPQETYVEKEQAFRKRRAEAAEAEEKARRDEVQEQNRQQMCTNLRQQLAGLESGQRIARFADNGEPVFMEDNERAAEVEKTRASIDKNCK
ncbi:DUF4124 domain-containing protein [Zoogloea dura]|uniref:DUF4124 domain-containing protein n=1 Tax=Zoogloea dura TaxID=2728840 RepID=A0A848G9P7_9RHOO|nr:DUF4124 domain-containing protein [Zoogloea dura]NML27566.1 DUF4124 domain-containing protein [Zoogloea dura]